MSAHEEPTAAPERGALADGDAPAPSGEAGGDAPAAAGEARPADEVVASPQSKGDEPAGTEPAATEPAETEPAATEPAETEPDGAASSTQPKRKRSLLRDALSLSAFLATALIARASLADHYVVPTGSMIPTVHEGDRVIVAKAAYGLRFPMSQTWLLRWSEPKRGDVVVLDSPDEDQVLLKRVVALPGDVVEVRGGKLILNGTRVAASDHDETIDGKHHPLSLASGGGPDFGPSEVPAGKVLVMGDNRGNSRDGRYFGFVQEASVLGHAVAIYVRNGSLVWDAL